MQISNLLPKWGSIHDREETALAEEKTPVTTLSNDNPIRRLSDGQLRRESKRRRIVASALSATGSIFTMVAALGIQSVLPAMYAFLVIVVLFGANISLLFYVFRWMTAPAKESARRRKNSVLEMLGVTPQPEP